ncbi:hypothetical protein TNCT_711281 [Trichonephila clavata]|uniref:Uncharacterized protein n=1 Tax=Trichonephila clavata TaxID=2740835 RepID=A0A8X6FAN1_TRICU|nr:hypothetical protein TNCT_711281 [Trichonephila clavata]
MDETQVIELQPVTVPEKNRAFPPFCQPKRGLVTAHCSRKIKAPALQWIMTGRFLKITVADDNEHRALNAWLEESGVEF